MGQTLCAGEEEESRQVRRSTPVEKTMPLLTGDAYTPPPLSRPCRHSFLLSLCSYPYSLRGGVPTVISHGLWLNAPDYDAPTQLLKPRERNTRHIDAVITVPAGVLMPMCGMNVAFDRVRIGPAFLLGLMGDGQPWGRYDGA
jgi:hypothetical protein